MTVVGSMSAELWKVYMELHDGVCHLHSLSHRLLYGQWRKLCWWVLNVKMLNVTTVIVSKMTSQCGGTVQMREKSESGIRKWEEMWVI